MRFQSGTVAGFFGKSAGHAVLVEERRRWIEQDAPAYAGVLPEGAALLDEALDLLVREGCSGPVLRTCAPGDLRGRAAALGCCVEPDCLLLSPDASGTFRLVAGSVCFASGWSLAEKMGHPLEHIHGVVPGLNDQIGRAIHLYLSRMTPGDVSLRSNWGLSRSAELNQHPGRELPRLDSTVEMEDVWLRVEHQALTRLPETGGLLFGIRIANHPLAELKADAGLCGRFRLALETMPDAMAAYKGLGSARSRILDLLRQ